MPLILAETNMDGSAFPADFPQGLLVKVSEAMGTPAEKSWLRCQTSIGMYSAAGKAADTILLYITSTKVPDASKETIESWAAPVTAFVAEKTGLSQDSIFIIFGRSDPEKITKAGNVIGN